MSYLKVTKFKYIWYIVQNADEIKKKCKLSNSITEGKLIQLNVVRYTIVMDSISKDT